MAQIDVITLALAKKFAGGFDPTTEQLAAINSGIDSEKVTQITRNKDNITGLTNDLHDHYYTQNEVMSLIASARAVLQVAALPATPAANTIYYVGTTSPYHVYLYDSVGQQVDLGTSEIDLTQYYTKTEIDTLKQDKLESGTNIKTINNESLLGSGNIDIAGGIGTETSLWSGNFTGDNTCTLSDNINNYDYISFKLVDGGSNIFCKFKVTDWNITKLYKSQMLIPCAWNQTDRRLIVFVSGTTDTQLKININGSLYIQEIKGIKGNVDISTLQLQSGISSNITNVNSGIRSWQLDVTIPAGSTPTGYLCSTEGNVGTVYISTVNKTSDTNVRLSGWYNLGSNAKVKAQVNWIKLGV